MRRRRRRGGSGNKQPLSVKNATRCFDNIHSNNTFNGVQVEDDEGSERWWCRARAPSAHDNKECGVFVCAGHCG